MLAGGLGVAFWPVLVAAGDAQGEFFDAGQGVADVGREVVADVERVADPRHCVQPAADIGDRAECIDRDVLQRVATYSVLKTTVVKRFSYKRRKYLYSFP